MLDQAAYYAELRRFFQEAVRFNAYLGMVVESLDRGRATLRLPYRPEFLGDPCRPALHGGVISALLDTCGGLAVLSQLAPGSRCSTVDLRVDYLRPGAPRDLVARASVLRLGNRVAVCNIQAFQDDSEDPVADGKGVYSVRQGITRSELKSQDSP
ncbi:MAG TPA: hotdog fold thioesterase [Candidatus Nitrosotenuis sp.]|jgi:uncharacterized protein (TIGR00369 family)|nr:hotdog fold thioesterase [Candidatus Nitrosotenuis sp.]